MPPETQRPRRKTDAVVKEFDVPGLLLAGSALFDDDDLATAVVAAARADVMRALGFTAVIAGDQVNRGEVDVPAAIALAMAADSLFGKRTHGLTPLVLLVLLKQRSQSSKRIVYLFVVARRKLGRAGTFRTTNWPHRKRKDDFLTQGLSEIQFMVLVEFRSLIDALNLRFDLRTAADVVSNAKLLIEVKRNWQRELVEASLAFEFDTRITFERCQQRIAHAGQTENPRYIPSEQIVVQWKCFEDEVVTSRRTNRFLQQRRDIDHGVIAERPLAG